LAGVQAQSFRFMRICSLDSVEKQLRTSVSRKAAKTQRKTTAQDRERPLARLESLFFLSGFARNQLS
jgi:hypothetical protein